eukprot:Skav222725  [mRNA]  locus=scaffold2390:142978:151550:+ [translate_table: standard]
MLPTHLMNKLQLADLPRAAHLQRVSQLITTWPHWDIHAEAQLCWDHHELAFHERYAVISDLILQLEAKCPTLLHSLGHLDRGCPCGCRGCGLAHERLARDGISAVAVHCTHGDGLRHLHPLEAGLLCSLPPTYVYPKLRESLPLIGQTAAPLQALWVVSLMREVLHSMDSSLPRRVDPFKGFVEFQSMLQCQAFHLWPTRHTVIPRSVRLRFDACILVIQVEALATVDHLISAQKALGGWGERITVLQQGVPLPRHAILRSTVYEVVSTIPRQLADAPSGLVSYCLTLDGHFWAGAVPAGTLVSDLLTSLGFCYSPGLRIHLDSGCWTWGDRIWHGFAGSVYLQAAGLPDNGLTHVQLEAQAFKLLQRASLPTGFVLLPIVEISALLDMDAYTAEETLRALIPPRAQKVFGIFWFDNHWAAFSFDRTCRVATYYDGLPGFAEAPARHLIQLISLVWNEPLYIVHKHTLVTQHGGAHCGVIALVNLGAFLRLWTSFTEERALDWFDSIMATCPSHTGLRGQGNADYSKAHTLLMEELPKHGVPADACSTRAALAIKRLGSGPILRAFEGKHPWQALKSLGNQNERPFVFVQHEELERHIENRAGNKKAPMTKQVKKNDKAPPKQVALTPSQVQLHPGTFTDDHGDGLAQISPDTFSPTARGIAVVSVEQAMRFLADNKKLSMDCLALLTLQHTQTPPDSALECSNLTWPGVLADSQEPLLIRGTCIQLGDIRASPKQSKQEVPVIENDLLRLFWYQDQCPLEWKDVVAGPLKALIHRFPALQFCPQQCNKDCPKYHPSVEEDGINMVVLDAFAWRWMDSTGRPTQALKANAFSIMVRVPKSATLGILQSSGLDGFYSELREVEATSKPQQISVWGTAKSKYAIVWLKDGYDDAVHKLRTQQHALHLVRFHSKYGLRCLKSNEAELNQNLFPGRTFVNCGTTLQYEMGPWPFGITRQAIVDVLKNMNWVAKPLRPVQGGNQGRYWLIGSETSPGDTVIPYAENFLTITQVRSSTTQKEVPNVVASLKTLQKISVGPDPWLKSDPWAQFAPTTASASASAAVPMSSETASSKLEEMESRLAARLGDQLKEQLISLNEDQEMIPDDSELQGRMERMETHIVELQSQSSRFEQWFQQAGDKMNTMQTHMQKQDANFEQLSNKVQSTTVTLNGLQQQIKQDLQAALSSQTEAIQDMLAKRHKGSEHPGPEPADATRFSLGCANPSGIRGKSLSFLDFSPGIYSISETQATAVTFRSFTKEIMAFQQPGRHLKAVHGEFAPLRSNSTFAGAWTGVAHLSDFAIRPISLPWRGHEWTSGRVLVSSFHFGLHCIVGAAVYAPPQGPTYPDSKRLTSELLGTLTEEIVLGRQGPRFIAGDMNHDPEDLAVFRLWEAAGWRECQSWALDFLQRPRTPTCKGATIRDHANYRSFEQWHLRRRTQVIQAKHHDHNRILFKQLKGASLGSLTHLRSTLSFSVAVVHSTERVELDRPVPSLSGSATWTLEGFEAEVEVTSDRSVVCISSDLLLAVGQALDLTLIISDFQSVDAELRSLWELIWNRHAGLAESHWDRVLAFGMRFLPPRHALPLEWTVEHLRGVVSWISGSECAKLRSRCMFALGWNRAGASPAVRWSLMQNPMLDPLFFQVWNVLSNFWRLSLTYPYVREAWLAFRSLSHLSNQGIFHAFEMALETLDWLLDEQWTLHVIDLRLSWHSISLDTLRHLAVRCWQQAVSRDVGLRKDYHGLTYVDVRVSFGSYVADTKAEHELAATIQDGTFFLNKYIAKFDPTKSEQCTQCGTLDTLEHRCLHCPRYAAIRTKHSAAVQEWSVADPCFTHHAMVGANPFLWKHWQMLLELPDSRQDFFATPTHQGTHHVYTDGSCLFPATDWKLAAWATVLMDTNMIISQGVVPGLLQTSDLAELYAVHSALCWALEFSVKVCIHCDNQYVLSGLDHLCRVSRVPGSWKYVHVWLQVLEVVRLLDSDMWETHQVYSHQDYCRATSSLQEWFTQGNAKADRATARAQKQRPAAFMENHQNLLRHDSEQRLRVRRQMNFLVDIARQDLQSGADCIPWDSEDVMLSELGINFEANPKMLAAQVDHDHVQRIPLHLSGGFCHSFRSKLQAFLISCDAQAASAKFVTGLELLAAYVEMAHGTIPIPRKVGCDIIYEDPALVIGGGLIRMTLAGALNTLKKALGVLFADAQIQCEWGRASRVDVGLCADIWAIRIGWDTDFDRVVMPRIHTWSSGRPWRKASDFARPI